MEEQTSISDENEEAHEVDPKLAMAGALIDEAMGMLQQAVRMLGQVPGAAVSAVPLRMPPSMEEDADARIVEGVFDGQQMIGPDGRHYSVPANYASKSKLVEGDLLKLSITSKGAFVYKQIGPIPRRRLLGELVKTLGSADFVVKVDHHKYKVLTASVTFFRGNAGDEVTILVPESGESTWAAVENIIKKSSGGSIDSSLSSYADSDDLLGVE